MIKIDYNIMNYYNENRYNSYIVYVLNKLFPKYERIKYLGSKYITGSGTLTITRFKAYRDAAMIRMKLEGCELYHFYDKYDLFKGWYLLQDHIFYKIKFPVTYYKQYEDCKLFDNW